MGKTLAIVMFCLIIVVAWWDMYMLDKRITMLETFLVACLNYKGFVIDIGTKDEVGIVCGPDRELLH